MLTYSLNPAGNGCLYEQLYDFIKTDILRGNLSAGERLPSKRKLAEHLGVSVVTVETAYSQLMAEGYIRSEEKRGYFVSHVDESPSNLLRRLILPEEVEPSFFMDFKSNHIHAEQFPFSIWAKMMRSEILEQDKQLLRPLKYNGVPQLRSAIADYLHQARGMQVHPDQILIGAGTEYLYNLLIQLLGRDKIYAVEDPGYKTIARIYRANDAQYVPVPIDRHGINVHALKEKQVNIAHISPAHHFPTGIVTSIARRQELLRWAAQGKSRYIIEDDYDSEFRFIGRPIPTLFSADENEKVIYINTFSKSIAPSIRISYLVLPPHLLIRYREKLGFYACTVPSFEQYTLARFISSGSFERHISRVKKRYRAQRDQVIHAIKTGALAKRCAIYEENAGLHFLVRLDTALSDQTLKERAASLGIRIACLSDYMYRENPAYHHILVMNYTGIDIEKLPEALDLLSGIIEEDASGKHIFAPFSPQT